MSRNLKVLGLTVVALLAMSAVVASAASAAKLTLSGVAEPYTAKITGNQTAGASNELVLPGNRTVKCKEIVYSGEYTKAQAEGGKGTATAKYEECTATILGNVTPATITTNGCFIEFTFGKYISPTEASATDETHLRCPEGKQVEVHVWQTSEKHLANATSLCTYGIPEQTIDGTVNFKITGDGGSHVHTYLDITGEKLKLTTVNKLSGTITNCGEALQVGEIGAAAKAEAVKGTTMLEATFEE